MFEINFLAKKLNISKEIDDMYYMVSISDDELEPNNYLIFQKTFDPDELSEDTELNGSYIECNGESCYNCCDEIVFNKSLLKFNVRGTNFKIDLKEVDLNENFEEYMKYIFNEKFIIRR